MNALLLLAATVITVDALFPFFPLERTGATILRNGSWRSAQVHSASYFHSCLVMTMSQPLCEARNNTSGEALCFNTSIALLQAMGLPPSLNLHSVGQTAAAVVSWQDDAFEWIVARGSRLSPHPLAMRDELWNRANSLIPSHDLAGSLVIAAVPSTLSHAVLQLSVATTVVVGSLNDDSTQQLTSVTSQSASLPLSPSLQQLPLAATVNVQLDRDSIAVPLTDFIPLVDWSLWNTSATFMVNRSPSEQHFMIGASGICKWPSCASLHHIQYIPVELNIELTGDNASSFALVEVAACLSSSIRLHGSNRSQAVTPLMCNVTSSSITTCLNESCLVGEVVCWFDTTVFNITLFSNVSMGLLDDASNVSAITIVTSSGASDVGGAFANSTLWVSLLAVKRPVDPSRFLRGGDVKCRVNITNGLKYSPLIAPASPLLSAEQQTPKDVRGLAGVTRSESSLSGALLPYVASVIGALGALLVLSGAACRLLSKRMWSAGLWSLSFVTGVVCLILVGVGYDEESRSFGCSALIEVYPTAGCHGPPVQLLLVDAYLVTGDTDEDLPNVALTCGRWLGLGDVRAPALAAAMTTTGGAACSLSNGLLRPVAVALSPSREACEVELLSQLQNKPSQWQQCQTVVEGTLQSARVLCVASKELPGMWSQWRDTFNALFDVQWSFGITRLNDSEAYPAAPSLGDVAGVTLTMPFASDNNGVPSAADPILSANVSPTVTFTGFPVRYDPPLALFSGNATSDDPVHSSLGQRIQGLAPALNANILSVLSCDSLSNASNCGSHGATYRCDEGGRPLIFSQKSVSNGTSRGAWYRGGGSGTTSWDLASSLKKGENAFSIVWWMKLSHNEQVASTLAALTEALSLGAGDDDSILIPSVEALASEMGLGVLAADPTDDVDLPSGKPSLALSRAFHKMYRVRPRSDAKASVRSDESRRSSRGEVYAAVQLRSAIVPVAESAGIKEVTISIVSKAGDSSAITWRFADSVDRGNSLPKSALQSESGLRSIVNVLSKSVGDVAVSEGDAAWHHIAIVCQSKAPTMECHLYLDGSTSLLSMGWRQCSAGNLPKVELNRNEITVPSLHSAIRFGETVVKCGSSTLNGSVGGFQVFPSALSRSQIKALMNSAALDESEKSGSIALIVIGLVISAISILFSAFDFVRETRADSISRQRAKEVLIRQQFEDVADAGDAEARKCGEDSFLRILRNDARSKQMGAQFGAAARSSALGFEQSKAAASTTAATGSQTTTHLRFLISSVLYVGQMLSVYFSNWSWPPELTDVAKRFVSWLTFDFNTQLLYNYVAPAIVVSLTGVVGVLFSAVIGDDNKRHQRMVKHLTQGIAVAKALERSESNDDGAEMRTSPSPPQQSAGLPSMQRLMDLQMQNLAQQQALQSIAGLTREERDERLRQLMQEQSMMILQQNELIREAKQNQPSAPSATPFSPREHGDGNDTNAERCETPPAADMTAGQSSVSQPCMSQPSVSDATLEQPNLAFKILLHTTTKAVLPLPPQGLLETIQRVVLRCNVGNIVGETDSCESALNGEQVTLSISATFTNGRPKTITSSPSDASNFSHGTGSAIAAVRRAVKQRMRQSSVSTDNAIAIECYATPHDVASLTGATRGFLSIIPNPPVVMCPRHERRVVFAFASHRQKLKYGDNIHHNDGGSGENPVTTSHGARCAFNSDLGVMYHKVIGHPRCPCFGEDGSNLLYGHLDYFYCPSPGCGHIVCECCFDGSLVDLMRSIVAGSIEVLREMGVMQVVGFVVLLVAQLLLAPVMQTCAMLLLCHAKYQCQFPGCYEAPSVTFLVYLALAALTVVAMTLFICSLLAVTIRRKKHLVRCVTPGSTLMPWAGLLYSLPHDVWRVFLDRDTSLLKSQYEAYRFRFVWVHAVVLTLKSLAVLPSVFAVPDSLTQLGGALAVETTLLILVTFVRLYNDKWIALMARCASVHQTVQLTLNVWLQTIVIPPTQLIQTLGGAVDGPSVADADSTRSKLSRAMLYVLAAYMCSVVAILLISVVFPMLRLKICAPRPSVTGRAARYEA